MPADVTSAATEQYGQIQTPANGEPRDASVLSGLLSQPVANALLWLRKRLEEVIGSFAPIGALLPKAITSVDTAGDTLTLAGHGLANGDIVKFFPANGGACPAPLTGSRAYYVVSSSANTFKVAATSSGSAIDITGAMSGSVYVAKVTPTSTGYFPRYFGSSLTPAGGSATYTADSLGHTNELLEPASDAIMVLGVASGPAPGQRLRFFTIAALAAHKITFQVEGGGSTIATFPISAGKSWVEFEFMTALGGWFPCAWGGGTTVP